MTAFHDIRFPLDIALHASGGPERRTDIVTLASGREVRNARWAQSRRRYDAGYGIKTLAALSSIIAFFEERRGRLIGFRWHDRTDWRSCAPGSTPTPLDQTIGQGDGARTIFTLTKTYGSSFAPYARAIAKPVSGTVRVAVNGVEAAAGTVFDADANTGTIVFRAGHAPAAAANVSAGFDFDVPVRFDSDFLDIDLAAFDAGVIPKIPLVEIIP